MKDKKNEILVIILFFIFGSFLLFDKFIISKKQLSVEWKGPESIQEFLRNAKKINDKDYQKDKISFLFVFHDNDCPPCIFEIMEYIDLLRGKNNCQSVALFVSNDFVKSKRSASILKLSIPIFYANYNKYQKIMLEKNLYNQIIVFNSSGMFSGRRFLSNNQITSLEQKNKFLDQYN